MDCSVVAGPVSPKYEDCANDVTTPKPTDAELLIRVINAVTGKPIEEVNVCYSCADLNVQACAATDSDGKLDAGEYPSNR